MFSSIYFSRRILDEEDNGSWKWPAADFEEVMGQKKGGGPIRNSWCEIWMCVYMCVGGGSSDTRNLLALGPTSRSHSLGWTL